jgi:hypothetical protein
MSARTERPGSDEYLPYYDRYIQLVPDGDIFNILRDQHGDTRELLRRVPAALVDFAYAPGKWTIKEVVGHVIDAERIFAYRALRFARADATPLAGFDENAYVPAGSFGERALGQLAEEFSTVRAATLALFNGLPEAAWTRGGDANGARVTVRALALIIAGHELHHRRLLEERYLAAAPVPRT